MDDRLAEVKNPDHIGALVEKLRERTGDRYLCVQSTVLWKSRMTVDSVCSGIFSCASNSASLLFLHPLSPPHTGSCPPCLLACLPR